MSDNPTPEESQAKLFGMDISLRGWLALSLVLTLCVITFNDPDMYADTFKITQAPPPASLWTRRSITTGS